MRYANSQESLSLLQLLTLISASCVSFVSGTLQAAIGLECGWWAGTQASTWKLLNHPTLFASGNTPHMCSRQGWLNFSKFSASIDSSFLSPFPLLPTLIHVPLFLLLTWHKITAQHLSGKYNPNARSPSLVNGRSYIPLSIRSLQIIAVEVEGFTCHLYVPVYVHTSHVLHRRTGAVYTLGTLKRR